MLILAHRGASGYAPENTVAAFDLGQRMGASGIETDVQVSRDGVMVLVHDERVDRTTDGTGRVADLTWDELSRLDAGAWFAPEFAGQRIMQVGPFLDRYLGAPLLPAARGDASTPHATQGGAMALPAARGYVTTPSAAGTPVALTLCLEVKAPAAAEPLVALLRERGLTARPDIQLSSFNWDATLAVRAALPDLTVGFLTPRFDAAEIARVAEAGLVQICPRADTLTPALVEQARARGLQIRAWGVATRDDLRRVYASGADGTTLNWPDWAAAFGDGAI